jgi:Ca2+/Na+ antiporter
MATTTAAPDRSQQSFSPGVQRATAAAGIGFAVLMVVSILLGGDTAPEYADPASDYSGYAEENQDNARLAALVFAFATYLFLLFLGWLRSELGRAEQGARGFTRGSYILLAGGTIGVLGLLLGLVINAVALNHPDAPPEIIRAIADTAGVGFVAAAPGFAAMFVATFLVSRATGALPGWLTWLALATGIFFLLQLLTLLSEEGDNAFGIFYPLAFLGLVVFAIGASLTFLKRIE